MNVGSSQGRRRHRLWDQTPSAPYPIARRGMLWAAPTLLLGMLFLFAGTRFWASAPFLIPFLMLAGLHQGLSLRGLSRGGGAVHPPVGMGAGLALLAYVVLRAVFASAVPFQTWTEAFQLAVGLLVYCVFVDLGSLKHAWSQAQILLYVAGALQAMLAVGLHVKGSPMVLWLERPASYGMRASGTWICPNHFAHFLQMVSVVATAAFLTPRTAGHIRLLAGYALGWMIPALLLSQSRSGLLGLVAGVGVLFVLKFSRKGWRSALKVTGGGLLAAWAGYGTLRFGFTGMYGRLEAALRGDIRFSQFWPDTWSLIRAEGWVGVGPGVFKYAFEPYREAFSISSLYLHYAHNEYLHLIAEYGWLPVLLLAAGVLWMVGLLLMKAFREEEDGKAMVPVLILALGAGSLLQAVFDFNFHILGNSLVLLMLLGLLEGVGRRKRLWLTRPLPVWSWRPVCAVAAGGAGLMIPFALLLGLGGWAEYRLNQAREAGDDAAAAARAAGMRKWVPMQPRGWVELGLTLRKEAFWLRDPERRAERIRESRAAYREGLARNPYDRIALAGLVELAKMEGDFEQALEGLTQLERLAPYDVRVRIQKGLALQKLRRYEESLAVFEEAKRLRRVPDEQIELNLRYLRRKLRTVPRPAEG